jgi:hypothetical protein
LMVSFAAGAIWPLLVVGLVELDHRVHQGPAEARIRRRHLGLVAKDA